MLLLLHSSLSTANDADVERSARRASDSRRDDTSRRALLLQLTRGRRTARPAHA